MLKKYLKIIIPILFFAVLGYIGYQIFSKINHNKEVARNIKTIPVFEFQNIRSGVFAKQNLVVNQPTIFVYFNSDCEFCNQEAAMFQEHIKKLNNIQILFISFEKPAEIAAFANKYKLDNHDNIHFLCDSKATFAIIFDVKSLPCLVLYDKNQQLIEKIKGQTKIETILKKLEGSN